VPASIGLIMRAWLMGESFFVWQEEAIALEVVVEALLATHSIAETGPAEFVDRDGRVVDLSSLSLATSVLADLEIGAEEIERLADAELWDPLVRRRVLLACKAAPELNALANRLQRLPMDSSLPSGTVYYEEFEGALQRFVEIIMELADDPAAAL
jgi:hypothetical protein